MKENTHDYSYEWKPYIGYDKFEYDIKLKSGKIITNCYPNTGIFNSYSDEHYGFSFKEEEIEEIKFSDLARLGINEGDSKIDVEYFKRLAELKEIEKEKESQNRKLSTLMIAAGALGAGQMEYIPTVRSTHRSFKKKSTLFGKTRVVTSLEKKIGRNEICPKCDSGLKYKKCCGK